MHISAKELRQMAGDVDDMHREAMRGFREETAALHGEAVASRRSFLRGAGLAGVGGTVLATAGGLALPGLRGIAGAQAEINDPLLAGYAQSLELAAVEVYTQAGAKLTAAVKPVAALFAKHHQDHADAFGDLAGDAAQTAGNPVLMKQLKPSLDGLEKQTTGDALDATILGVAMQLENQVTFTYVAAMGLLKDPSYSGLTSTVLPIEAQHATVIATALDLGPSGWFPTDAFESSTVGDGTDPLRGLDPATYIPG